MIFELMCFTMFGLLFGSAFAFAGYSVFRSIIPVFGFLYGFVLGANMLQLLLGFGFLTTLTSWIIGMIVGIIFGILSYMFFRFTVALAAGSLAYGLGVSIFLWLGLGPGFITWLIGVAFAAAMIFITYKFRIEKYVIVLSTSTLGAAIIVNTLMSMSGEVPLSSVAENPIREMLSGSPLWTIFFLSIVVVGAIVQLNTPRLSTNPAILDSATDYDPVKHYRPPY